MRIPSNNMFQQELALLNMKYENVNRFESQNITQLKLQHSSDDPVLASRIKSTVDYMNNLAGYQQNLEIAQNRAQTYEDAIADVTNTLTGVQTYFKQAQNGTMSDVDRSTIASQLKGMLSHLTSVTNMQDANGDYIFSGTATTTPPFVLSGGNYIYQGNMTTSSINIAPNTPSIYTDSGFAVFGDIYMGNGTCVIEANSANTGTGIIYSGGAVNQADYVADTYTISFVDNGGQLTYQVVGATSGQVIPVPPATPPTDSPVYDGETKINFNGINLQISGGPKNGDTFTVSPAPKQNMLDWMNDLINVLEVKNGTDPTKIAQQQQKLSQLGGTFEQLFSNITAYGSTVGSRMQIIQTQADLNKRLLQNQSETYKNLAVVDPYKAASDYKAELFSLQIAQETYGQLQSVMMDLLRMKP